MNRARAVLIAMIALPCALYSACFGFGGEVAENGCPDGEICIGQGLRLSGGTPFDRQLLDWWNPTLYATAVGGTQRFEVTLPRDARVISGDPSVLVIESLDDASFTVRGVGPGSSLVRIVDDEDRLYERIQMPVAEVASIALRPETLIIADELPWAFFRGERQTIVVFALLGPDGERLIDEAAMPLGDSSSWDSAVLDHPIDGDELTAPIVMGSGETRTGRASLVDRVDRWVRTGAVYDLVRRPSVRAGEWETLCFMAMSAERAVAYAPIEPATEGGLEAMVEEFSSPYEGGTCVRVRGSEPGDAVLIVRGGGAELRQSLRITP